MELMSDEIKIELTLEFQSNLKKLVKKYRSIRSDLDSFIRELQQGNFSGDRISGLRNRVIYKVRIKNSDITKGKSGGYRIIYLLETQTNIVLLTIYGKSEREDIAINEIKNIIDEFYS